MEYSFKMEKKFIDIKKKSTKRAGKVKDKFNDVFNCCNENNSVSYRNEIIMQTGLHNLRPHRPATGTLPRPLGRTATCSAWREQRTDTPARHCRTCHTDRALQGHQGRTLQRTDERTPHRAVRTAGQERSGSPAPGHAQPEPLRPRLRACPQDGTHHRRPRTPRPHHLRGHLRSRRLPQPGPKRLGGTRDLRPIFLYIRGFNLKGMTKYNQIKIFEEKRVRAVYDDVEEKWCFAIVDACAVLTGSTRKPIGDH